MERQPKIVIRSKQHSIHKNLAWNMGSDGSIASVSSAVLTSILHLIECSNLTQ